MPPWLEPDWVKVKRLRLSDGKPSHRFVHFTDLHHKGGRAHLQSLVKLINAQSPDFVCFTGDIIDQAQYLPEALELLEGIKSPMYGVRAITIIGARFRLTAWQNLLRPRAARGLMDEQR